jgi:hypothetical protein
VKNFRKRRRDEAFEKQKEEDFEFLKKKTEEQNMLIGRL